MTLQLQLQGVKATKKLRNIQLSEVSLVDVPANPGARIMLLKHDTKENTQMQDTTSVVIQKIYSGQINTRKEAMDSLTAALGGKPDEAFWRSVEGEEFYTAQRNLPSGIAAKSEVSQPADTTSAFTKMFDQEAEKEDGDVIARYEKAAKKHPNLYAAHVRSVRYPS